MSKLGKCCCSDGDCLTPFDCDTWTVDWDSYSTGITSSFTQIENTTTSGTTNTVTYNTTCSPPRGSLAYSGYIDWSFNYRLRLKKGHTAPYISCIPWPTGWTEPDRGELQAGSDTGLSTFRIGSQCYAVFHVMLEVYYKFTSTYYESWTRSGFTGSLSYCNGSGNNTNGCPGDKPNDALYRCIERSGYWGFTSDPIPYSTYTDLQTTHVLYANPGFCTLTSGPKRVIANSPFTAAIAGQNSLNICAQDFFFNPCGNFATSKTPVAFNYVQPAIITSPILKESTSDIPTTMEVTLGGCKKLEIDVEP